MTESLYALLEIEDKKLVDENVKFMKILQGLTAGTIKNFNDDAVRELLSTPEALHYMKVHALMSDQIKSEADTFINKGAGGKSL